MAAWACFVLYPLLAAVLSILLYVAVAVGSWFSAISLLRYSQLPLGPKPKPIIGNVLEIRKYGSLAEKSKRLAQQYSNYAFYIGSLFTFFVSDPVIVQVRTVFSASS